MNKFDYFIDYLFSLIISALVGVSGFLWLSIVTEMNIWFIFLISYVVASVSSTMTINLMGRSMKDMVIDRALETAQELEEQVQILEHELEKTKKKKKR